MKYRRKEGKEKILKIRYFKIKKERKKEKKRKILGHLGRKTENMTEKKKLQIRM